MYLKHAEVKVKENSFENRTTPEQLTDLVAQRNRPRSSMCPSEIWEWPQLIDRRDR